MRIVLVSEDPKLLVYDQNGKQLDFYTDLIKGKIVAINFILFTCTASCPPINATFRKKLSKRSSTRARRKTDFHQRRSNCRYTRAPVAL